MRQLVHKIYAMLFCLMLLSLLQAETFDQLIQNAEIDPDSVSPYSTQDYKNILSTPDGRLYAYTVLLFNNNPHFLNVLDNKLYASTDENQYAELFEKYIRTLPKDERKIPENMLLLFKNPSALQEEDINKLEDDMEKHSVIAKFIEEENGEYTLDYCIFGSKELVTIEHPFLLSTHKIYCIQPFILYDEFYSSNSTFYHDLIYIDANEVKNDAMISREILKNSPIQDSYYVGAKVNEDIRVSIKRAFPSGGDVEADIRRIFIIHEMTHKVINNRFNYYNRIVEEELAIASTMYANPFLGLSVVYSYLNYNYVHSPHRIAALKFLRFAAEDTEDSAFLYNPSKMRTLSADQLRLIAYRYFYKRMELVDKAGKNRSAIRTVR